MEHKMRRKDREIKDFEQIVGIVDQCEIVRLGIRDEEEPDFPYIVPVNFAYTAEDGQLVLYIHGAMAGRKYELLKKRPLCSFEMDVNKGLKLVPEKGDVTTKYQSVMGKAKVDLLEGEERQSAIDDIIMDRYELTRGFPYHKPVVAVTAVFRLTVTELSAKSNIKGEADI